MTLRSLALQLEMPIFSTLDGPFLPKTFYKKLPYQFVKKYLALPIKIEKDILYVALCDPLNMEAIEGLRSLFSMPIKSVWAPKEAILDAIDLCFNQEEGAASKLIHDLTKPKEEHVHEIDETSDLLDDRELAPIIKLLNLMITEAIQLGASDIHFEPFENDLKVRFRIDGVLHKRHAPPREYQAKLITRLKVMAKLDIAEHRLPQDGRLKLKMGGREIDFRLSTLPVAYGERIVLRILDKGNVVLGLSQIGMPLPIQIKFQEQIRCPEGIVLVTGPTGSGKTTTLYSAISELYSEEVNIMTIEDPIEYKLQGIAQMQVQSKIGLDFSTGLRHILRQDPDVILIGEIRDRETAEIAIQSSLTGHLVLSTLHTNDAPSAITRLVDMGIEPYLLSSSIISILAQRLVRTLCPSCKVPYTASQEELFALDHDSADTLLYKACGCALCYHSGYKGRAGLYELMTITPSLKRQMVASPDASILREHALKEGLSTLLSHGKQLVLEGRTTLAEVLRIVK